MCAINRLRKIKLPSTPLSTQKHYVTNGTTINRANGTERQRISQLEPSASEKTGSLM